MKMDNSSENQSSITPRSGAAASILSVAIVLGLLLSWNSYSQECVPPANKKYKTPTEQIRNAHYRNGGRALSKASHKPYRCMPVPPPGTPKNETFESTLKGSFSLAPGGPSIGFALPAVSTVHVGFSHFEDGGATMVYTNHLLGLDASDPVTGLLIRESPTLSSTGMTRITVGPTGPEISSFFNPFIEASMDGGTTWLPSVDGAGSPLSGHVELLDDAPEYFVASYTAPPPGFSYVSPPGAVPITFPNGVIARRFRHTRLLDPVGHPVELPPLGSSHVYSNSTTHIEFEYSSDGGFSFDAASAMADVTVRISLTGTNGPTHFFDTEMLSLDISGGNLPLGVRLRESPSQASLGDHTVRSLGGGFMVRSTFDVELELSTDHGLTWLAADIPAQVDMTPAPVPPNLAIQRSGSKVVFSWPASSTGSTLQATPSLGSPLWSDVTTPVVVVGERNTVTVDTSGSSRFCRLRGDKRCEYKLGTLLVAVNCRRCPPLTDTWVCSPEFCPNGPSECLGAAFGSYSVYCPEPVNPRRPAYCAFAVTETRCVQCNP